MRTFIRMGLATLCSFGLSTAALAEGAVGGTSSRTQLQTGNIPVPRDAREVLEDLHHGNQREIELAQVALQKAQTKEVKELANRILQDHQQADQQVQQVASSMSIKLDKPKQSADIQKKFESLSDNYKDALSSAEGMPFDQLYATAMVLDHDKDVALFSAAQHNLRGDQQVMQLLDRVLPKLDQHRSMALDALKAVQPTWQASAGESK